MSLISGVPFLTMLGAPVSIPLIECPVVTEDLANRRREVLRIERKPDIAPLRASRFAELVHTSDEGRRQFNGLCMRRQANAVVPRPRPHETGQLQFFGAHAHLADAGAFAAFLAPLRRKRWFVYTKRPFAGPKAVLAYLSRYTHRVAISNRRLIALNERRVIFKVKDYRIKRPGRYTTMTLDVREFVRRFLIHVLPKGFHRIRHYGLFAGNNRAETIDNVRKLLNFTPPAADT